jgi:hypothetical protein
LGQVTRVRRALAQGRGGVSADWVVADASVVSSVEDTRPGDDMAVQRQRRRVEAVGEQLAHAGAQALAVRRGAGDGGVGRELEEDLAAGAAGARRGGGAGDDGDVRKSRAPWASA